MTLAIQRTVVNSINTEVKIELQQYRGQEKTPAIKKTGQDLTNTEDKKGLQQYRRQKTQAIQQTREDSIITGNRIIIE